MAYLSAVSSLDNVIQYEIDDPTQTTGGPGGGANAQAQALLNRTKYIYDNFFNRLTQTLDNVPEGTSYKRIQAAKADALNMLGSLVANNIIFVKGDASGLEYHKGYYSAKALTFASGGYPSSGVSVSYTGIGFKPSRMIVLGVGSNGHISRGEVYNAPDGGLSTLLADVLMSNYSKSGIVNATNAFTPPSSSICAYLYNNTDTAANYILARPVSLDADGFTVTWYFGGTLTATFTFYFIPIR